MQGEFDCNRSPSSPVRQSPSGPAGVVGATKRGSLMMFPPPSAPRAGFQRAPLPPLPLMSQWLKVGVPVPLYISAPTGEVLSRKMQLATLGEPLVLYIPPPLPLAAFPVNVLLVTVGEPYIPAPSFAILPVNVQLVTVPETPDIPPPQDTELAPAVLPLNVQLVTVGEPPELYIPPPTQR